MTDPHGPELSGELLNAVKEFRSEGGSGRTGTAEKTMGHGSE